VAKEKKGHSVSGVVEGRHGFDPFGEVIDYHDDVLVPISRWRVASHEVYAPFAKGANNDDWVKQTRCFL
jgi:hypothetical protein